MENTEAKKESQNTKVIEYQNAKGLEKELIFVLHCLVSITDSGGRVNYAKIGNEYGIRPRGASDKLWRILVRYGLSKNQREGTGKLVKAQKTGADDKGEKVEEVKRGKRKYETQEQEQEDEDEEEEESDHGDFGAAGSEDEFFV